MKMLFAAAKKVFSNLRYVLIAILAGLALLIIAIWLPNFSFIESTLASLHFPMRAKLGILISSLSALGTNFTLLSRTLTVTLTVLFGINAAFLAFYLRTRVRMERSAGVGFGGILAGLFGVGCASCGSVVISAFLGAGATAEFLNILPLRGQEFGLLGVALMLTGIGLTAKKIEQPFSCAVDDPH